MEDNLRLTPIYYRGTHRDRDQLEVDFVIERAGQLVGIEVKTAVSVGSADLRGLKRLREAAGKSFACGVLLHDGDRIQRVGDDPYALPVSQLWDSRRRL